MCWASSNCTMKDPVCQIHEWGEVCGPWAITQPYWVDGGSHGEGFYSCVLDWQCNENTVRGYMAHYLPSPYAKCEDYARTHAGGPLGSSNDNTLPYWYTVKDCLDYSLFTPPTLL
ncbi:lysozyme-like [Panulirus ornatus]|uniref:lysozyme-like n=1 Tax=Panulirus ornatus TaxID=150431 RepID=UPI003A8B631F